MASASPVLELEEVSAGYGHGLAIDGVSVTVLEHEVVCVLGRNGAGKTSLARTIMGLLRAERGRVALDAQDVTRRPTHERARLGIACVAQDRGLFPGLTVAQHFGLLGRERAPGLAEAFDRFPVLRDRQDTDAVRLSGGERKMLQFAMAMLLRPRLLVLDEPTEGVAPLVVRQLQDALQVMAETMSVLLIEQNLATATSLGDRGYVLQSGRVIAELDRAAVRSEDAVRRWIEL